MTQHIPADDAVRANSAAQSAPEQRAVRDQSSALTIIGTITSQVALVTALFYYFGWVYIHSFYSYFGIDINLLGYSTADYVVRSINVAFLAFMYLAFAALALLAFHRLVMVPVLMKEQSRPPLLSTAVASGVSSSTILSPPRARLSRVIDPVIGWVRSLGRWRMSPSHARCVIGILQIVAVIFALVVFAGVIFPDQFGVPLGFFLPLLLMFSVSALGYIAHVRSRYPEVLAATTTVLPMTRSRIYISTLLTLGFVAGLWAVGLYGDQLGTHRATEFAAQLSSQPEVLIYSAERIALNGPGINVSDITQSNLKYHCQYTGLRLLAHTPDKLLLLPVKWQHGHDRVFILRDDDSIRIDIIAQ